MNIIVILFCILIILVICDYILNYVKIKELEKKIEFLNFCCAGFQSCAKQALEKYKELLEKTEKKKKENE